MNGRRHRLPGGTLRLRGSTYWAQWKRAGRPFAVSLGTKDLQTAKTRFAEQMSVVRASIIDGTHDGVFGRKDGGLGGLVELHGDIPLSAAWECFAASPRRPDCSADTLRQYQYQFGRFVEWVGEHRPGARVLSQVCEDDAVAFAAHLQSAVSPSTFNRYRDLLAMVFRVLLTRNGHMPANPWVAVQRKHARKGKNRGRRAFTAEELRRVFLALQKRLDGRQLVWAQDGTVTEHKLAFDEVDAAAEMLTIALLGVYTGLRLGDCCLLRWDEVVFDRKVIVTDPSKTARRAGRPVIVPIHPDLLARLLAVRPDAPGGFVCPCKAEQYRRNKSEVSKRFSALFRQCGFRLHREGVVGRAQVEVGFHSLRYSFVSLCRLGNGSLAAVESLVGHSNPEMTRHYTDIGHEAAASAVASLPSFLGVGTPVVSSAAALPVNVSSMGDGDLKRLAEAVAAEAARRKG